MFKFQSTFEIFKLLNCISETFSEFLLWFLCMVLGKEILPHRAAFAGNILSNIRVLDNNDSGLKFIGIFMRIAVTSLP